MRFNCLKEDLIAVLNAVANAVAVKPQTQILGGIYLNVKKNTLEIQATNYSIGMMSKIPVDAQEEGTVVVIGKKFIDVVRALTGEAVIINEDARENLLEVASGKSKFLINTMNAYDFPKITSSEMPSSFKIKAAVFKNLIKKTAFACATDEVQPIYTGCLFESKGDTLTLVATNKHRMALASENFFNSEKDFRFVIPRDALRIIYETLPNAEDELIKIDYNEKKVAFTIGKIFITARIIDGNFPDYRRIVPSDSESVIKIDTRGLRSAIERVSLIAREDFNKKIMFDFTSEYGLELKAASAQYGAVEETLDIEKQGEGANIAFNYVYLMEALRIMDSDQFRIFMRGRFDPVDIREADSDKFIYILTPLRP